MRSQDFRQKLAKEGKQMSFGDAGKLIGTQWAAMPADEKQKWNVRALSEYCVLH